MDDMTSLLERLRPRIERLGGGGHDGEELYAEVALACVEKRDRYDWSHPKIEGRVIRIARNLQNTRLRRKSPNRKQVCLWTEDCPELALEDSTDSEARQRESARFYAVVDTLPDRYRQVIHEHCSKGKRLITIARQMGLPSATIRTRYRRALQQLARDPEIQALAEDDGR